MNYIGAREGVPVPTKPYERAGRAEWVVCGCGHKGRPGAFHICIDLSGDEPELPPKPEPKKPKAMKPRSSAPRAAGSQRSGNNRCACGVVIDDASRTCKRCYQASRNVAECGTPAGYQKHRRLAKKDPANNPWPLPEADECGCRAAYARRRTRKTTMIKDRIDEVAGRYLAGESAKSIASDLGVSAGGLRKALNKHGVEMRKVGERVAA